MFFRYFLISQQLLTKLFYICDTTLASQGELNMTKTEFSTEVIVKAPLTIDGQPILFDLKSPQLLFCRKGLEPYVNEASKTLLLSQPLPNLYPLARTIHIHKKNIYRSEHKFRKLLLPFSAVANMFLMFYCSFKAGSTIRSIEYGSIPFQQAFHQGK